MEGSKSADRAGRGGEDEDPGEDMAETAEGLRNDDPGRVPEAGRSNESNG